MSITGYGLPSTAAAVLVALSAAGCSFHSDPDSFDAAQPIPVQTGRVTLADGAETFEAGGIVQARTTATVSSRILAPIQEVRVAPGDRVRAGQVLVVLDGRDLEALARSASAVAAAASERATAAAAEERGAQAALTLARATYERIAGLQSKRSATQHELDEATAALRAAEARATGAAALVREAMSYIESARAASQAAGTTESFTRIAAPFDGIVTSKMVEPGNMAAPGTPLLRVEDTRAFRLEIRVDESRASATVPGSRVDVLFETGPQGAETLIAGEVAEMARAIDADSRAFLVKISLPATANVRSGMFGRARFKGPPRRALTVPESAIVTHGQVTSVFVVDGPVARLRLVSLRGREVLAGLGEGDVVILNPPPGLVDGKPVTEGG